jgi:ABC-type branched-subunit amino acid transport system permease subunit
MIIFAVILLVLMLYRPKGLWPERHGIANKNV